jgi:hypothetical protein
MIMKISGKNSRVLGTKLQDKSKNVFSRRNNFWIMLVVNIVKKTRN